MKPEVLTSPALPSHCLATGIGSLPHQDPEEAVRLVLKIFPELPFWPQLPRRSPEEGMTRQFDHPILYRENAAGFFELIKALQRQRPAEIRGIKGQITGPATWLVSNYFESGEILLDGISSHLAMNAVWQIEQLRQFDVPVVIFLDEPVLGKLSRYPSLSNASLMKAWTRIVNAIHETGGPAGIHCCDQMDWGLLFRCPMDIISFDTSLSFQDLLPHVEELKKFLDRGGRLSWGAIPTTRTAADSEDGPPHDLEAFEKLIQQLSGHGIDPQRLARQSIVTPACGLTFVSHQAADEILHRVVGLANGLKKLDAARFEQERLVRIPS